MLTNNYIVIQVVWHCTAYCQAGLVVTSKPSAHNFPYSIIHMISQYLLSQFDDGDICKKYQYTTILVMTKIQSATHIWYFYMKFIKLWISH